MSTSEGEDLMNQDVNSQLIDPALDATEPEDDLGDAAKGRGGEFIDQESDF
jgi:hypothetical protein